IGRATSTLCCAGGRGHHPRPGGMQARKCHVTEPTTIGRPVPWWVRAYLLLGAFQGVGIGLTGFFDPGGIQIPFQMSPLNARFVGALYLASGIGVLAAAFSRRREETRLFVVAFGLATLLILLVTALHWTAFMGDGLPHRVSWIASYVGDPLLALAVVVAARFAPPQHSARRRFVALLLVECALLS